MFKYILIFLISSLMLFTQTKTKEQLAIKLLESIQKNDFGNLSEFQATADIYRKIAPSQMEGLSDVEILELVNTGEYSLKSKLQSIANSLFEESVDAYNIKLKSLKEKKFKLLKLDWKVYEAIFTLEKTTDTLIIEVQNTKNGFYLIDIANDDREFANFIKHFGKRDAEYYYAAGLKKKEKSEWKIASDYFRKAIQKDNKKLLAYYELAYSLIELNDYSEAERLLLESLKFDSEKDLRKKIWDELGYLYQAINKYDEAVRYYQLIIDSEPSTYFPYYSIGMIEYSRRNYKRASEFFSFAIKNNPSNYFQTLYMNGMSLFKDGNYQEAQTMLVKSLEIEPDNEEALYVLGWIYNDLGYFTSAIDILQVLLNKFPRNYDAKYELGYAYKKSSLFKKSLDIFLDVENYLKETNDNNISKGKLFNHIGEIYSELDDRTKSCEYLKKASTEGIDISLELMGKNCK